MPESPVNPAPAAMEWTVHPARSRPGLAATGAALIVAFGAATWVAGGGWAGAVISVAGLLLATNRFFLPTRYRLDAEGIRARYLISERSMPWSRVQWFRADAVGGAVSPRSRPSRVFDRQAIHLLWDERGAEARAFMRAHLRPDALPRSAQAQERCHEPEAPACAG